MSEQPKNHPAGDEPRLTLLQQRKIEARVLVPLIQAFRQEIGDERTFTVVRRVIEQLGFEEGRRQAEMAGANDFETFRRQRRMTAPAGLVTEIVQDEPHRLGQNVTSCAFKDFYTEMGVPELGFLLSCSRDFAKARGFNPHFRLTRTQTLMQGAAFCDFRWSDAPSEADEGRAGDAPPAEQKA